MSKVKFLSVFVLLVLLLNASLSVVAAKESWEDTPPPPNMELAPGLSSPATEWTDAELERLVELVVNERITVPQSEAIAKQLTPEQIEMVGELLATRAGVSLEEWRQSVTESRSRLPQAITGEIWRQPIEYYSNLQYGARGYYYNSSRCGGDDDWVYYFRVYYAQDPDGLRWWIDSSKVYWVFLLRYGLNLNGFADRWDEVQLCVGKSAASAAGEPDYVKDHLFVRHWGR